MARENSTRSWLPINATRIHRPVRKTLGDSNTVAREGALNNLSPALSAGFEGVAGCAAAEAAATKLARSEHFVVAAFAATKLGHVRLPRAERGAKIVERAFARR